jgi:tetratricopeptide (TPR) repeat protein
MSEQIKSADQCCQTAKDRLRERDFKGAAKICLDALQQHPQHAHLLTLMARVSLARRQSGEARMWAEKAISQDSGIARAHEIRADVCVVVGDPVTALQSISKAAELNPEAAHLQLKLANILNWLGRPQPAIEAYERSLRCHHPGDELVMAARLERQGRLKEAVAAYNDILVTDPDNAETLRLLARQSANAGARDEAITLLKRAVRKNPDFAAGWEDLGRLAMGRQNYELACEIAQELIRLEPHLGVHYTMLAFATESTGDPEGALDYYRQALQLQPDHEGALGGMGNLLKTLGRQDEAIECFRKCIQLLPEHGEYWFNLANLKTFRFSDPEVAQMEKHLANPHLPEASRANFCFALAMAMENRREFPRAFGYLRQGNGIRHNQEGYRHATTRDLHDRLMATFTPDLLDRFENVGCNDPAPVFIVGLPRSGSTLIEQILASHSRVEGTQELGELARTINGINVAGGKVYPEVVPDLPEEKFSELGQTYLELTKKFRVGDPLFTDKNPANFAHVGLLKLILPRAKIINARRHPLDSCLGSFKQLFSRGGSFSYDLIELGQYYLQYQRLMDHWHRLMPGRVLDVHYEDIVADVEGQVRRMLEYCELPYEEACVRFHETRRAVRTASAEQVRQPIYRSSLSWWRNYEAELEPLIQVLAPVLEKMPVDQRPAALGGPAAGGGS